MQQPSAQGIASLFRGNPAPLQQRIQQEQQGKPGLPPDLHELMALNIVTNEKDAVAKQQALDQLAQMQGPQGKPPTVMESVREQARQKMQAQAVQAQQQQQGLQALAQQAGPGPVPKGTQFAQAQPRAQGIDELPVEFGLAGGGIVAFQAGGQSLNERAARQMEEKGSIYDPFYGAPAEERKRLNEEAKIKAAQDWARESLAVTESNAAGLAATAQAKLAKLETNRERLVRQYGAKQYAQAVERAQKEMSAAGARGAELVSQQTQMGKERVSAATPPPEAQAPADIPQMTSPQPTEQTPVRKAGPMPAEKPIADLKALADQKRRQQAPPPVAAAPVPAPVPAATEAAPAPESQAAQRMKARLDMDPDAAREAEEALRLKKIGAPDTSTHDRMIAELEKRKAQLDGPKDQWGQLMEYLGQIAATPRGMSSFEAGAAGAANLRSAEKARQLEQFDLSKQALEVSQKKLDTVRAFATEQYNVGKARFDQVYKEEFEAAKALVTDEREAKKLAQENTLKRLELESAERRDAATNESAERRNAATNAAQLQAARISAAAREAAGGGESKEIAAAEAAFARDPEAAALKKQLENPIFANNPAKSATLITRLRDIQASKYAQFGIKMQPAPGAPQGPGGTSLKYNPATGKIE
jgi:hypothetical protein